MEFYFISGDRENKKLPNFKIKNWIAKKGKSGISKNFQR
jgi:hypothetical protein